MGTNNKVLITLKKNCFSSIKILPIFIGVILSISLLKNIFGIDFYQEVIIGNLFLDSFIFNIIGSVMAGNAMNSYIIANDMLIAGIGLFLVLVFVLAWVTVGIVQLPAESILLGKRFAYIRNLVAFFSNFLVALIVVLIMGFI